MQYRLNAAVHGLDGDPVGHLNRLIVSSGAQEVTHLVVHTGWLFGDDRVVAVDHVEQAAEDRITLFRTATDVSQLPLWTEVPTSAPDDHSAILLLPSSSEEIVGGLPTQPQQTAISAILLREGVKVMAADGIEVGDLETVATGSNATTITFLRIGRGLVTRERRLVPISWVSQIGDDVVHLNVDESVVTDSLPL